MTTYCIFKRELYFELFPSIFIYSWLVLSLLESSVISSSIIKKIEAVLLIWGFCEHRSHFSILSRFHWIDVVFFFTSIQLTYIVVEKELNHEFLFSTFLNFWHTSKKTIRWVHCRISRGARYLLEAPPFL